MTFWGGLVLRPAYPLVDLSYLPSDIQARIEVCLRKVCSETAVYSKAVNLLGLGRGRRFGRCFCVGFNISVVLGDD